MDFKRITSFVSGALFGSALGAYFMKQAKDKENYEAIASMKRYYRDRYGDEIVYKDVTDDAEVKEEVKKEANDPRPDPAFAINNEYHIPDDNEYSKEEYKKLTKNTEGNDIYVISEDSFYNDFTHYDKESYIYYTKDGTLTDEGYEVIEDPDRYVGDDLSIRFSKQDGIFLEEDPIFIRNDRLGVDFKITPRFDNFFGSTYLEGE